MTKAILTLDGMERLEGEAEVGGDYVRLFVADRREVPVIDPAARGEIEIDGRTSQIVIENISAASGDRDGIVLTMRLFKPIG